MAATYTFATLNPQNNTGAIEANAKFLGSNTLGIEVTIPALALHCGLGNVDPQHTDGNVNIAAIEVALMAAELPIDGAFLVTIRPDLDSVGAMAIFALRARGVQFSPEALNRIQLVAESDRFARGGYPGPRPLPTKENPWPESGTSASDSYPLAAMAAAIADFKVSMADRVSTMEQWIISGEEPANYRVQVERERLDTIQALENGNINVSTSADGRIAMVVSTHRAATTIGYCMSPVVVALNPAFRFQGGEPHIKYTVCQFTPGFVALSAAIDDLKIAEAEKAKVGTLANNWGGTQTICGSPQGVSSKLTIEEVVSIVSDHVLV